MIKKLLLIRKKTVESDLLDKADIRQYVVGDPTPALPAAWDLTQDISHYAFVLHLKLKQWLAVKKWHEDKSTPEALLLELVDDDIEKTLATVGLKVHTEAE